MSKDPHIFMPRKSRRTHVVDAGQSWAVSYGDMITQFFVFFVIIASMSNVNTEKFESLQNSLKGKPNTPSSLERMKDDLEQVLKDTNLSEQVELQNDQDGVLMVIKDKLLFASGKADIGSNVQDRMQPLMDVLKTLPPMYRFSVEGHTDDVPISTSEFPSNWHLASARALSVLNLLKHGGIAEERVMMRAYADKAPLLPNFDEGGQPLAQHRKLNRRVVIRIM